jgi:hypothetical protein
MRCTMVSRNEDMSPNGMLRVVCEHDGDVIICIEGQDGGASEVQFCASGGRSPLTLNALRNLFSAIERDNEERPI